MIIKKLKSGISHSLLEDQRGKHEPANSKNEEKEVIIQHIKCFPLYESHYTRRDTKKLYLPGIVKMHELYVLKDWKKVRSQPHIVLC